MTQPETKPIPDRITVKAPAVGSDWSFTNSDGGLLLVRSVNAVLTASAAVANRVVAFTVSNGETVWLRTTAGTTQLANAARNYCAFCETASPADSAGGVLLPWRSDGVLLRQGHVLAAVTAALDVGDVWSAIVLDVLRFLPQYPDAFGPYPGPYVIE